MALAQGDRLGRYRIIAPIGAGGMGEVYRAHDDRLDRDVAIKILPIELVADSERLKRFEREGRATAALSHPNIVAVYDFGTHEGVPYLVEELLEGESLGDALGHGRLPLTEAIRIAGEIAKGLEAAHEKGIVHRDLKPANVYLPRSGAVKILDFGLARLVVSPSDPDPLAEATTAAMSTRLGTVLGTSAYMAPEQARGQTVDRRADIFAFGVVLYELLAGVRPFHGETATDTVASILKDEPAPLPGVVPAPVATLVSRCLAKDPDQRYQSGGEVRAALEAAQRGVELSPRLRRAINRSGRWWLAGAATLAVIAATVVVIGFGGLRGRVGAPSNAPSRAVKLAVLPFANLSGDPQQDYLSDGFTQEMITELGRLHPEGLSVVARTSVMRYKQTDTPVDQIARELNVDYVLEGSARREANRVRIATELIQVEDQTQLWAESYERELAGILALQSEVAQRVAMALALELLPAEQARLARARTVDPEAYEAYLKGTQAWTTLTNGGLDTAQRYLEFAVEKDPTYAAAWAGIARVWNGRRQMGIVPQESLHEAKAAALKALELDESDPAGHLALAGVLAWGEWDWAAAEREWTRLFELDPDDAESLSTFSHFLMITGRRAEAMEASERAMELDPFNVKIRSFHAVDLLYLRRYDDAITTARAALRMQSDAPVARYALYQALHCNGMFAEALALDREGFASDRELMAALELGYAESGYTGARRRWAEVRAARVGKPGGSRPMAMAHVCAYAGDRDHALEWLERAYEEHDANLAYIGLPLWDFVRPDPRFQDLLRRMNLPRG